MPPAAASGSPLGGDDRRSVYGTLAVLTILGAALRVSYLDEPMRWDEARLSLWAESWSFTKAAVDYSNVGNHILHTLAAFVTQALFGAEPWSVRLPSLIAGVALIPAVFLTASALFAQRAALLAAALVAGSPYLTFYSINSRGYILQALLILLLLWLLVRLVEAPSRRLTIAAGVAGTLALYTLPTTLLVLPGLYLAAALWAGGGGALPGKRAVGAALATALLITGVSAFILYLPVVLFTGVERILESPYSDAQAAAELWEKFGGRVRDTMSHWTWDSPLAGQWVFAVVAGIGLIDLVRQRSKSAFVVPLVVMMTLAVSLGLQRVPPVRGYTFLMPFFLMLVGVGIHAVLGWPPLRRFTLYPLVAVLLAASGMWWTWSNDWIGRSDETGRIAGAEAAMEALAEVVGPTDRVAPTFPQPRYYVQLHDLPVRFAHGLREGRNSLDDADKVYILIRSHRESLRESFDKYFEKAKVELEKFEDPELFAEFPDLRVFVMSRRAAPAVERRSRGTTVARRGGSNVSYPLTTRRDIESTQIDLGLHMKRATRQRYAGGY